MKLVGVWSPYHQLGTTSVCSLLVANIGLNYNIKTLVTHNQYMFSSLESALIKQADSDSFTDIGVDSLERLLLANRLDKNEIENYTTTLIRDRLDILVGSRKHRSEDMKSLSKKINIIFSVAKQAYDLLLVDLNSSIFSEATNDTIKNCDYVIVVLEQNLKVLKEFFTKSNNAYHNELNNKKYCIVINNYDANSKYTVSYIKKLFKFEGSIYPIPYNVTFKDSFSDGNCLDFAYFNNNVKKGDPAYPIFNNVQCLAEHVLKETGFINTEIIKDDSMKSSIFDKLFNLRKYNK